MCLANRTRMRKIFSLGFSNNFQVYVSACMTLYLKRGTVRNQKPENRDRIFKLTYVLCRSLRHLFHIQGHGAPPL